MAGVYEAIKDLGGDVLAVSFSKPERIRFYLDASPQPFPLVCDPELAGYRAFSLGRVPFWSLFRPGVLARFVKLIARGWLPSKPTAGDDILQLGGDFVLAGDGKLIYAHASEEPTDRPDMKTLLNAVRNAKDKETDQSDLRSNLK